VDGEFNAGVDVDLSCSFFFPWVMVQFKLQPQSLDLSKVLCVYDVNTQRNVKLEGGGDSALVKFHF
jgi:hypothetical protein